MVEKTSIESSGTLTRGLELLRLLNEVYPARVSELEALTSLPKSTLSRLLHTMVRAGYVSQNRADRRYSPASRARMLGAGVSTDDWIGAVAAPIMNALADEVQWPSDLAVFEGRGMTIRHTTRRTAPIEFSAPIHVSNLPMLESDFGRAYLAFTSESRRAYVLRMLQRSDRPDDAPSRDTAWITTMLEQVRRQGYATRGPGFTFPRASTIAVSILVGDEAVASLNIICGTRVFRPADIPARMLAPLRDAAARIAESLTLEQGIVRIGRSPPRPIP
jgi:IclR family mhp operon transcriptional activator